MKKKILTVVGARPQFIKAAVIRKLIGQSPYGDSFSETLVHTGQHYDKGMSDVFFQELGIKAPEVNLGIANAGHGQMTGRMLAEIESIIITERPDVVLVYGDTNSTLAAALAASKLQTPVAHVESGLRNYMKRMPEEQNRIITDHLATWLFCPTSQAVENLKKEGFDAKESQPANQDAPFVANVGDIMFDASLIYRNMAFGRDASERPFRKFNIQSPYRLATVHRAENTDEESRLRGIVDALNELDDLPIVFPIHPRTKKKMDAFGMHLADHIKPLDPLGYLDMIDLEAGCELVLSDSGGVQKEAFFYGKPCVNLFERSGWTEAVEAGWIVACGVRTDDILSAVRNFSIPSESPDIYGDGNTGKKILDVLSRISL